MRQIFEGWRVAAAFGWLLWLLAILASLAMNGFAGFGLGRTAFEGYVITGLSAAADGWKAIAPIYITKLVRRGSMVSASFAALIWLACFAYAVTSAIGFAGLNRSAITGGREAVRVSYASVIAELIDLRAKHAEDKGLRSAAEIEASIRAALSAPAGSRGTVGSLSDDCAKDNARARDACAAIAELRIELAQATEKDRVDRQIGVLEGEANRLSGLGGSADGDPQERLIARLSMGLLASGDVGLVLVLILVAMVELISAFGPVVISEFVRAHNGSTLTTAVVTANWQGEIVEATAVGNVFEFMAACVRPAPEESVPIASVTKRYGMWCHEEGHAALSENVFLLEFDRICRIDLEGRVKRLGFRVKGLRLRDLSGPRQSISGDFELNKS